ncbi:NADH dehydrogenase [ubiquinone] 1 beta subcomplex subunit 2, mitochondrial-like [Nycticebus coucang]|uniref:NADH dehydrogenase [ubiquinone] 1 beta subcomplex subunit 2, mitochondrial-like n=1 Tax=Nycticebus coucang TaxID=9470 RepID=UPI00234DF09A|nr:NADH dehydrogenase [ubiquinone] 1 beta subcomplex subunit 2, mitochondrial-like [Nycticebus coucang]
MSAVALLALFIRVAGRLFRGCRQPAARGGGVRHAGGGVHIEAQYRQFPQLTGYQAVLSEIFSTTMWFWILWHFWHDSDAVLGHFPYPDPSQWTEEELGIPLMMKTKSVDLTLQEPGDFPTNDVKDSEFLLSPANATSGQVQLIPNLENALDLTKDSFAELDHLMQTHQNKQESEDEDKPPLKV